MELTKIVWIYQLYNGIPHCHFRIYDVTEVVDIPGHLPLSVAASLPLLAQTSTSSMQLAVAGQEYVYTAVYSANTLCPLIIT